jgi:UDP-perosamine 4-acetyltransferase
MGSHLIIGARATICVHARIGSHTVISTGAIVEHDNVLGDAVFLHPAVRLAGGVRVDALATLGIGAAVIPYKSVGAEAVVEPGAVVIRDVPPGATVGGIPAVEIPVRSRFVPQSMRLPDRAAVTGAQVPDRPQPVGQA